MSTTPPRIEGAGLMDGLREAIHATVKECNRRRYVDPTEERDEYWMTDRIAAAVRAHDAAHPPQPAPQPVPVVVTGAGLKVRTDLTPPVPEPFSKEAADLFWRRVRKDMGLPPADDDVAAWRAMCEAAGATFVEWDDAPGAPAAQATVPVPGATFRCHQCGETFSAAGPHPTTVCDGCATALLKGGARFVDEQATVPGGGRDFSQDVRHAIDEHNANAEHEPLSLHAYVAAELTRLGWVHGGAGGARLSDGARETITLALSALENDAFRRCSAHHISVDVRETIVGAAQSARVEIEALPRVGVGRDASINKDAP